METKKVVIIAWRFAPDVSDVPLASYYIRPIAIGDGLIPDDKFQDLLQVLENATSELTAFVHKPDLNDNDLKVQWENQMAQLKAFINRDKEIHILNFSGGYSAVYREFIDQDDNTLKAVSDEDITGKIRKCVQELDVVPRLIQLHKRLILAKLWGAEVNNGLLKDIGDDDESLKEAIRIVRVNTSDLREQTILDYISTQVKIYGA